MSYGILSFVVLMAVWVVFSGLFDAFHLALGVASAGWVAWMSSDLFFADRSKGWGNRWRELKRLPGYVVWLTSEIVVANLHVLYLALHPRGLADVKPVLVQIKPRLKSEFARWVLANSITLTPGTVTVKLEGEEFLIHAISRKSALGLQGEMEQRVAWVFEPEALDGSGSAGASAARGKEGS